MFTSDGVRVDAAGLPHGRSEIRSQQPVANVVLVHTVMSRKEDVGDSNSAPTKLFSRLALGDAESSPTDLTAATNNYHTNHADKAVQEALNYPEFPAWVKRWLQEPQCKEQWGFARYVDHGDVREKFREQAHIFDDELDNEELCIVDAYKARRAKFPWQITVCMADGRPKARVRDLDELEAPANDDEHKELALAVCELHKHNNMKLLKQKLSIELSLIVSKK